MSISVCLAKQHMLDFSSERSSSSRHAKTFKAADNLYHSGPALVSLQGVLCAVSTNKLDATEGVIKE